jgi:4-amino-4-deoxy-L-arabinose transferase-like glycosyltransferase
LRRDLAIISVLALPLFFWGIGSLPFRDPDEGLYGAIAREMVERGDWLTPRFNGVPYLEKPPLYYWLVALTYALFGFSEWGARLWPALGASATALLTAFLGCRAFGPRVGTVAGLVLATSLGVFVYGRVAGVDLVFTALVTLAVYCLFRWRRGGGTAPRVGFYLAVALAALTKGALGLLLPGVLAAAVLVFRPRPGLRELGLGWGVPLVLALVVPWHLLASRATPGFLGYYVLETHLLRFLRGTAAIEDEVPLSTPAFLLVSLVWLLPWSLFLPSALVLLRREWGALPSDARSAWAVLLLWAGLVFALFGLSAFKLEHYALPAFPPFALLVARLWCERRPGWLLGAPLALGSAGAMLLAAAVLPGGALTGAWLAAWLTPFDVYLRMRLLEGSPLPLPTPEVLERSLRLMAGALLFAFGAAALAFWRGSRRTALGSLLAGTLGFLLGVGTLASAMAPYQTTKGIALGLRRLAEPSDLVLYEGYLENAGGLPYYSGRQIHLLGPPRGDLAFASRLPEGRGLFHAPEDLARLWSGPARVFLVTDRPPPGSAVDGLVLEGKHLLLLDHGKRLYSNRPVKVPSPRRGVVNAGSPGATCCRSAPGSRRAPRAGAFRPGSSTPSAGRRGRWSARAARRRRRPGSEPAPPGDRRRTRGRRSGH